MGGGIAPGLPLRIPKMRHPRKLRKKKLHIIYLKGTHKKGGPKKNFRVAVLVQGVGCIFGTGGGSVGVLWEAVFGTEGVYCGWHFWYRGGSVGVLWEAVFWY